MKAEIGIKNGDANYSNAGKIDVPSGKTIATGVILVVYNNSGGLTAAKIAQVQREHVAEVISSQRVQLENDHSLEMVLLQGPADDLVAIKKKILTCRGVKSGDMHLTDTLLPPIYTR